jgi:hypothetical protein
LRKNHVSDDAGIVTVAKLLGVMNHGATTNKRQAAILEAAATFTNNLRCATRHAHLCYATPSYFWGAWAFHFRLQIGNREDWESRERHHEKEGKTTTTTTTIIQRGSISGRPFDGSVAPGLASDSLKVFI